MAEHLHAYTSLWQVRGHSWCRLDEAADRLARPTTTGPLKDKYAGICRELLNQLTSLEHYWATPAHLYSPGCKGFSRWAATTSSRTRSRGSTARSLQRLIAC
jgi:hypothetical protein